MTEIKLEKRFPHIPDEDVTRIFQDGYMKGWENARKKAIPIEWIEQYMDKYQLYGVTGDEYWILHAMLCAWECEEENETHQN